MQNIKYCPKCNQVAPSIKNTFCPFDGTTLIEMNPISKEQIPEPILKTRSEMNYPPLRKTNKTSRNALIALIVALPVIFCCVSFNMYNYRPPTSKIDKNNNSTPPQISTPTPEPSALSPKENLEAGKKALNQRDFSLARNHLSAIPKGSQEYAEAKKILDKFELYKQRAEINDELERLANKEAQQEELLNQTENMKGTIGKQLYLNALKRKAELQLQRIELERKLKKLPL